MESGFLFGFLTSNKYFNFSVSSTYTSNGDLVKCLVTGHSYPDCENLTVGWKAVDIATVSFLNFINGFVD